ncbi:hypothetical protein GOP47_0016586 [Adiantum capillus-veneris]|uniref:Rhodanese domain-containing protein n=1 Tax=Adiantum capillus-veneris TaxID=13818 RepID=A0A9D4UHY7_ADICA|nr:hypothetical protein GOP47_0016586 [Adiantum capillus-veneris]
MEHVEDEVKGEEEGVLLYYKFVSIPNPETLALWFNSFCSALALVGRIRVAPDGVNVTIGGTLTALHKHINAVKLHPWLGNCDFKLASAHSTEISRSAVAPEVGFSTLAVRVVKELVTFGVHSAESPSFSDAGTHLSALEFHRKILEGEDVFSFKRKATHSKEQTTSAASLAKDLNMGDTTFGSYQSNGNLSQDYADNKHDFEGNKELVILDVRNIYETRIGKFVPPEGVDFLDPQIRQYSDLPQWIDSNTERLQNKNILMYCTGGVRCEMASAYLKKKGEGFQNVFQLSGGIQRYLEAFPDGGFFKGKNFVFDHRVAVPSSCPEVLGTCLHCGVFFDDYSSRIRCSCCRMLVLVCKDCQAQTKVQMCELCKVSRLPDNDDGNSLSVTLNKHSSSVAGQQERSAFEEGGSASYEASDRIINGGPSARRKLRILCLHGFRQSASSLKGRLAALTKKLKGMAEFVFVDAPHVVPLIFTKTETRSHEQKTSELRVPHKKFAWLVSPEMTWTPVDLQVSPAGLESDVSLNFKNQMGFDKDQYKRQTMGWPATLSKLEEVFSEFGHFDGVLGFSQGAAVAASLCLLSKSGLKANSSIKFQFVILCSGFILHAKETQDLISSVSLPLNCPSLHIFADSAGHDRQIVNDDSVRLKDLFNAEKSVVLTHGLGHIVPSQKERVEKVKNFLSQFI